MRKNKGPLPEDGWWNKDKRSGEPKDMVAEMLKMK